MHVRNNDLNAIHYGYHKGMTVHLNQKRIYYMLDSARQHDLSDCNTHFWCNAYVLVHEVGGHILVSHLTMGRRRTPDVVAPNPRLKQGGLRHVAEAGRCLEEMLSGGTILNRRDPHKDDTQPGIPLLSFVENGRPYMQQVGRNVIVDAMSLSQFQMYIARLNLE